jgi:hypothetical protein
MKPAFTGLDHPFPVAMLTAGTALVLDAGHRWR